MIFFNHGFWAHIIVSCLYLTTSFIFDSNFFWVIALNDFYGLFLLCYLPFLKDKKREVVVDEIDSFLSGTSVLLKIYLLPLYAFSPILGEFDHLNPLKTSYLNAAIFIPLFYSLFKLVMMNAFKERSPKLVFLGLAFIVAVHIIDYKFSLPFILITIASTLVSVTAVLVGLNLLRQRAADTQNHS